jgi:hypothetical protein
MYVYLCAQMCTYEFVDKQYSVLIPLFNYLKISTTELALARDTFPPPLEYDNEDIKSFYKRRSESKLNVLNVFDMATKSSNLGFYLLSIHTNLPECFNEKDTDVLEVIRRCGLAPDCNLSSVSFYVPTMGLTSVSLVSNWGQFNLILFITDAKELLTKILFPFLNLCYLHYIGVELIPTSGNLIRVETKSSRIHPLDASPALKKKYPILRL